MASNTRFSRVWIASLTALIAAGSGAAIWLDVLGLRNSPPSANLTVRPMAGSASSAHPLVVTADAGESSDPDNDQLTFSWRVKGQARSGSSASLVERVTESGTFDFEVTVSDGVIERTATKVVVVEAAAEEPAAPSSQDVDGAKAAFRRFQQDILQSRWGSVYDAADPSLGWEEAERTYERAKREPELAAAYGVTPEQVRTMDFRTFFAGPYTSHPGSEFVSSSRDFAHWAVLDAVREGDHVTLTVGYGSKKGTVTMLVREGVWRLWKFDDR